MRWEVALAIDVDGWTARRTSPLFVLPVIAGGEVPGPPSHAERLSALLRKRRARSGL